MNKAKALAEKAKENIMELTEILEEDNNKRKSNPQTEATKRYQEKNGLMSKSYKLKEETVREFAVACEEVEISQAYILDMLMKAFVKTNHEDIEEKKLTLFFSTKKRKKK